MAIASEVGLASRGSLQVSRVLEHSAQTLQLSIKRRKAFSWPDRKTSRSSLRSLRSIRRVQADRASGLATFLTKWKTTARRYSRKKRSHSATEGTLGGQE